MRLIDADELMKTVFNDVVLIDGEVMQKGLVLAETIDNAPTVDAVKVVLCEDCVLHGNCIPEDSMMICGIKYGYYAAGKRKGGDE